MRRTIVAHENPVIRASAADVLRRADFEVIAVADYDSARALLDGNPTPVALVVDVGLTGQPFYALCQYIERRGLRTKTVLIASVYSRTAYKRRPTSLYGAHDYVEQHHIVDSLVPKVELLVRDDDPSVPNEDMGVRHFAAEDSRVRVAGERRLRFRHDTQDEADELATRLARLIVADLALYSAEEISAWRAAKFDIDAIPKTLSEGLAEARQLFNARVPPELAFENDFVLDALLEFVAEAGD